MEITYAFCVPVWKVNVPSVSFLLSGDSEKLMRSAGSLGLPTFISELEAVGCVLPLWILSPEVLVT